MWLPNQTMVEASASKMRFYDDLFGQVASTPGRTAAHPERDLISASIVHREAMAFLIDSEIKKDVLSDIQKISNWKFDGKTFRAEAKGKGTTLIEIDSKQRITRFKVVLNKIAQIENIYTYVDDTKVPFIPATAKVKQALQPRPEFPKTVSPKAVSICHNTWRAMSRLGSGSVKQVSDTASYETTYGVGAVTEKGGAKPWSYSNSILSFGGKTQKVSSAMALDNLKSGGVFVSPMSRYLMNGQIPFLDLYSRPDAIVDGGSMSVDGKMANILNISRSGNRIRIFSDAATGKILLVSNEARDSKGNWLTASRLKLTYR